MNAVVRGDVFAIPHRRAIPNIQDCSVFARNENNIRRYGWEYVTVALRSHCTAAPSRIAGLIGMGAIILNGAKIGNRKSIIAAGTLIPERTVVEPALSGWDPPASFRRKPKKGEDDMIMRYCTNYLGYTQGLSAER